MLCASGIAADIFVRVHIAIVSANPIHNDIVTSGVCIYDVPGREEVSRRRVSVRLHIYPYNLLQWWKQWCDVIGGSRSLLVRPYANAYVHTRSIELELQPPFSARG
jgi:hypothetical protein